MMSLMPWQKLTERMTAKAVACAEVLLAVAGAATEVAVVSVKAMLRGLFGGEPQADLAAAWRTALRTLV
jgi:hypothetical protein